VCASSPGSPKIFSCQVAWRRFRRMSSKEVVFLRLYQGLGSADCGARRCPDCACHSSAQIIDVEDQRSGSLSGFGDSILRIFKTGELLHVTEADFQWPAQGKGLQDLPRFQGEVGRLCATLGQAFAEDLSLTVRVATAPAPHSQLHFDRPVPAGGRSFNSNDASNGYAAPTTPLRNRDKRRHPNRRPRPRSGQRLSPHYAALKRMNPATTLCRSDVPP
jgi:hypothetical protein